jgi:hypothetical protein
MADVRMLIETRYPKLDMTLIREYFALFDREKEFEDILREIKNAK